MALRADRPVGVDRVIGLTVTVGPHQVSPSRMSIAHSLIWSTSELHARATPVDGGPDTPPLASGPWVAALIAGLYAQSTAIGSLREAGVALGGLIATDVRYEGPVYGGDLIYAECAVRSYAPPSSEGGGRIVIEDKAFKAPGQPVLTSVRTYECGATSQGVQRD
jgi:acyl dehydratase